MPPSSLPSRAWSCQTLQNGLTLAHGMSLDLASMGEDHVAEMMAEMAKLQVGCQHFKILQQYLVWFGWENAFKTSPCFAG